MCIFPTLVLALSTNTLTLAGPTGEPNQPLLQPHVHAHSPENYEDDDSFVLFSFPGGTAAEYVEAVRTRARDLDVYETPINVIASPGLEAIRINPVDLIAPNQDFFDDAIAAITDQTHFIEPGVTALISVSQFGMNMNYRIYPEFLIEKGPNVVSSPVPPNYKNSTERAHVAAYAVGTTDAQAILDTVAAAIDLGKLGEMTEIMVHTASGTLIVRGTPEVHQVVEQVITAVREQAAIRNASVLQNQNLERQIQERLEEATKIGMAKGREITAREMEAAVNDRLYRIQKLEQVILELEARLRETRIRQSIPRSTP